MPRPQRIEYENAFYHVMNRGRERHTIFHGDEYRINRTYMDTPPKSTRNLSFRAVYSTNSLYLLYIPTRQCK
jgi:hypothetical protein